jgi:hypothetical protein
VEEKREELLGGKVEVRQAGLEPGVELLGQEVETVGVLEETPAGMGDAIEVLGRRSVGQCNQGIEIEELASQKIRQQMACTVGERSAPLADGGVARSYLWVKFVEQALPAQPVDQVQGNDLLE